ncbi:DUF1684 domain-containing protein [Mucilaginibacter phyllosphaerae]|uniref:DUF1684 domain-containing protein n=1 Tax=Mucilaginibacter phyllosphaerae TaxID=1812349 RepID=A0A4Y8AHM2_9SPHI|nr:DUF1684 domain-containing protein [Mucilaginibacter phyllosphaerae]MBB3968709.1 hypothetical protein [Mucilaginibacter phyllosphaerae]TEW67655.1 DUF1684 domain-containing protein [Mucilaginibacter phyllosphaerae]GGH14358.1 hypothetical protein GCM10007352_22410 [Mucilaginibacter phyllosphaerae]
MKHAALILLLLFTLKGYTQTYSSQLAAYREQYKADFLSDSHSPLKEADLKNLQFFDADSTYRVTARMELLMNESTFQMPTFSGAKKEYIRFARITFKLSGKPQQLYIYRNISLFKRPGFEDYLFLPFTDDTNGTETYGGGRYLDLKVTDIKNGTIVIDFNKAYNPYCAYSEGYQCPMPPPENNLEGRIRVGEKSFKGEKR